MGSFFCPRHSVALIIILFFSIGFDLKTLRKIMNLI